jgi:hypothetical protein
MYFAVELVKKFTNRFEFMKSKVIYLFMLLLIQSVSARMYESKAVKFATRNDAYPYGEPKEINANVILDLDNRTMKVSNIPDYCFDLQVISETPKNNGKLVRLSSICPEHKRCFIVAYIENNQIINLEIKFVTASYMYYLAAG